MCLPTRKLGDPLGWPSAGGEDRMPVEQLWLPTQSASQEGPCAGGHVTQARQGSSGVFWALGVGPVAGLSAGVCWTRGRGGPGGEGGGLPQRL